MFYMAPKLAIRVIARSYCKNHRRELDLDADRLLATLCAAEMRLSSERPRAAVATCCASVMSPLILSSLDSWSRSLALFTELLLRARS